MKVLLMAFVALFFIGCSNQNEGMEARFKKYMADTVTANMNDPKSYEFVSMEIDTVYNHRLMQEYLSEDSLKLVEHNLKVEADTMGLDKESKEEYLKHSNGISHIYSSRDSIYKKDLSEPDYIYKITGKIKYRGKNKLGALVLNEMTLNYDPKKDKITPSGS